MRREADATGEDAARIMCMCFSLHLLCSKIDELVYCDHSAVSVSSCDHSSEDAATQKRGKQSKSGGFLLTLQEKIKKLAGGAAGAGRRWLRRLRSQTQALTAQEATFEGRGEREEISLRQCVLRDHQIRSGSGLFIHSASTHHYTNRSVGQAPRLHRRIWQRRR